MAITSSKINERYQEYEKRRYRDFLCCLSDSISFEDDCWYCEKHLKNRSHNKKHVNISFRQIPKIYREMVKYYALIRLINGVGVYTISCRIRNIAIFLQFLNGAPLSDIDYVTASDFKSFLDNRSYTENTRYTIWAAAENFLHIMNGYDGIPFHNPLYKNPYTAGERLDYKYNPDFVARQLDMVFMKETVPLPIRTVYWLLRLIPSRISEILGMEIDCPKPFDGHYCLTIPTWKQNGGYKEPLLRIIHIHDEGIGGYLLALIREQQKAAHSYQEFLLSDKKGALFTRRQSMRYRNGKICYKDVYGPLTYVQVRDSFQKICREFDIRDESGEIYTVTTHQFRHNGITDRLRAGFTLAQIAEMTAHHGSAMIYASYAHLDLFPETLSEPREYFCETPKKGSPYILFSGRILNMDAITEARLLANLRAHRVPGGICANITHCRSDMWNCLECVHFIPEKEQLPYFEEQEKAWRDKAEKFKNHSIMEANFTEIADQFQQIIQKMRKEESIP